MERGRVNSRDSELLHLVSESRGTNFDIVKNIDGETFHDVFETVRAFTRNGELVDVHDNYSDATCYLSTDGLSGFAITHEGDLVSVFNANGKRGFLDAISNIIKQEARTLDCYVSKKQNLQEMYSKKFGFKTASIMDWNQDYDHDGIGQNHDNPSVAFMVNTDEEVITRHFGKDDYNGAKTYQLEIANRTWPSYVTETDIDSSQQSSFYDPSFEVVNVEPTPDAVQAPLRPRSAEDVKNEARAWNSKVFNRSDASKAFRTIIGDLTKNIDDFKNATFNGRSTAITSEIIFILFNDFEKN